MYVQFLIHMLLDSEAIKLPGEEFLKGFALTLRMDPYARIGLEAQAEGIARLYWCPPFRLASLHATRPNGMIQTNA